MGRKNTSFRLFPSFASMKAVVEKILALKKENPDADVSSLESEIDQLVYDLYNLTDEEVKIVEGKS